MTSTEINNNNNYSPKLMETYNQTLPGSPEELTSFYDKWANKYDEDYKLFGYEGPKITAKTLAKFRPDKSVKVIEFGSGTGMVGNQLHAYGFYNVDAVDMSPNSLKVCEEKSCYKSLICAKIGSTPLPVKSDTYDALVTCGTFIPGHLNQSCFPEMVRIVKAGGIVVLVMREEYIWTAKEYKNNQLANAIQQFADEGKWEVLCKTTYPCHFHDKPGIVFVFKVLQADLMRS